MNFCRTEVQIRSNFYVSQLFVIREKQIECLDIAKAQDLARTN